MLNGFRQTVAVQPGGVVEARSPKLPDGETVEVIVLLESQAKPLLQGLSRFIGAAPGNFSTPEEADQFIHQKGESWD